MAEWVTASAMLLSAGAATYGAIESERLQEDSLKAQKKAQNEAAEEQRVADENAERERLEALAANQTATDYGNIWGADSAKYADAAQKLSAGTGSFNTDDDEQNPFYQRGLL